MWRPWAAIPSAPALADLWPSCDKMGPNETSHGHSVAHISGVRSQRHRRPSPRVYTAHGFDACMRLRALWSPAKSPVRHTFFAIAILLINVSLASARSSWRFFLLAIGGPKGA